MKSQWTLSIEKNTDNFHYKWMSPIHSLSMEGRHATVTYCRPHFRRYNLFHYSCVCFIWKMLWSFFFLLTKKYIFPYLIKSLSQTTPIPVLSPAPLPPPPGSPQTQLLFQEYKRKAHTAFTHSQSIIQFKISGKCRWLSENEMSLALVDCAWWDPVLSRRCYDLQFLLYTEGDICFHNL